MQPAARAIDSILAAAVEIGSEAERRHFVDQACAGDAALIRRVEELIENHFRAGNFLEAPPAAHVATITEPVAEGPGTVIGPYKLMEQIGEGGMGLVFVAEQQHPVRRKVALKVIKPGMDTRQVIARFEAERQALALMDHPNIAKVLDGGTTGGEPGGVSPGRPYFVMELVKGVPITDYCDQNQLPIRERLGLFLNVCEAVQHAHQKGIIHRDIKPSNVLVMSHDGKPVVRVIDFGIAKAIGQQLTDKTIYTQFAQLVGTPLYMSPEQAGQSGLDVDTRSDIYSLGVLLYELLTGTTPFDKERLKEVGFDEMRRIIQEEEPPRPSTRISTVGQAATTASAKRQSDPRKLSRLFRGELDWIVMKALEKERDRRYETASALAADVQRFLNDEPVQACPPSAWYRLRKFARRNKGPVLAASVIGLVLVAGIAGTATGLVRALVERNQKDQALRRVQEERDQKEEARQQTRQALNTVTDEVLDDLLGRQVQLTDEHREFLKKLLAFHEAFAAAKADDPEGRKSQAEGHFSVARILHRLGEAKEAEAAYRDALAIDKQLAAEFPMRADLRWGVARDYYNLAILLHTTGRQEEEAEAAWREALVIQKQLAADFPKESYYRSFMASTLTALATLLRATGRPKDAEAAYNDALVISKRLVDDFPDRPEYCQSMAITQTNFGVLLKTSGRREEAEEAYGRALVLLKPVVVRYPKNRQARQELARAHYNLGVLLRDTPRLVEAEAAYRDALAIQRPLADEFPRFLKYQEDAANTLRGLAALLGRTGQQEKAEAVWRDTLLLYKRLTDGFPSRADFRQELARCHANLGKNLQDTRPIEAEAAYGEAIRIYRRLVTDFAKQPKFRHGLAKAHYNLGLLHCNNRRPEQAAASYGDALALLTELASLLPTRADIRHDKARTHTNLGNVLWRLYRPKDAEESYGHALVLLKQLLAEGCNRAGIRHDLALTHINLGNLLRATPRLKEARESYGHALVLLKQVLAEGCNRAGIRHDLALTHYNLGGVLQRDTGRLKEAEAAYRDALALQKPLADDSPRVHLYQHELAATLGDLAFVHHERGEFAAAVSLLEQARPYSNAALKADPKEPSYRNVYHNGLRTLAASRVGLADHAGLATAAEELDRFGYEPANDAYLAARCLSCCVTLADKDARLEKARRKELVERYSDAALEQLRRAVARGYKDAANLRQAPVFEPLRGRKEFGKLLADLEAKTKK
jgi:serine/threonine protein kinase